MYIIDNNNYPEATILVMKTLHDKYDYYLLILKHDATGQVFTFNVGNESINAKYFKFTIDLTGLPFGEYTYYISGNDPLWNITIDNNNIFNSCYTEALVFLGGITSLIFISEDYDFAVSMGDSECVKLPFLLSCKLQYFSFNVGITNNCNTYKTHECCKGE